MAKPGKCSFCNRTAGQVSRIIQGPGVSICDECIRYCSELLEEETPVEQGEVLPVSERPIPPPGEIKRRLDSLPAFQPRYRRGWLARYTKMATSANTGASLQE